MKKLLKNIALAAVIGFAVGVGVSFLAPMIGAAAGIAAANLGGMANPVFMGLFAGSWGALGAVATPAITWIGTKLFSKKEAHSHDINISSPQHTMDESRSVDCPEHQQGTKFQDMERARRSEQAVAAGRS
jgi:hypothetical protein